MKYTVCASCGAHLDFGEVCDCKEQEESQRAVRKGGEDIGGRTETAGGAIPRNGDYAAGVERGESLRGA